MSMYKTKYVYFKEKKIAKEATQSPGVLSKHFESSMNRAEVKVTMSDERNIL